MLTERRSFIPYLMRVNFNTTNATELARALSRRGYLWRPRLLINCQQLDCLRDRGVCYFVSQLLLLHRAGAKILLANVDPTLYRALNILHLNSVLHIVSAQPAPQPETWPSWRPAA